jgi:hypothetical protein
VSAINFIPQYSLRPKTSEAPAMQQVFFLGQNTFYSQFKIPRKASNMNCHTTTPEILDMLILSLILVLKET